MLKKSLLTLLNIIIVCGVATAYPLLAKTSAARPSAGQASNNAKALALLKKVDLATQNTRSLTANCTYCVTYPDSPSIVDTVTIRLLKPNFADIMMTAPGGAPTCHYISDGHNLTVISLPENTYKQQPIDPNGGNIGLWDAVPIQAFFGVSKAIEESAYVGDLSTLRYDGTESIGGTTYQVLRHKMLGHLRGQFCPFDQKILIGPDDLIHRYVLNFTYNGQPGSEVVDLTDINTTSALQASDFTLTLPSGIRPLTSGAD